MGASVGLNGGSMFNSAASRALAGGGTAPPERRPEASPPPSGGGRGTFSMFGTSAFASAGAGPGPNGGAQLPVRRAQQPDRFERLPMPRPVELQPPSRPGMSGLFGAGPGPNGGAQIPR